MVGVQKKSNLPRGKSASRKEKRESKDGDEVRDVLREILSVLVDIFRAFGFAPESQEKSYDLGPSLAYWCSLMERNRLDWMTLAKYKTAAFFAHWMKEAGDLECPTIAGKLGFSIMPPCPFQGEDREKDNPGNLLGNLAYRWLRLQFKTWDVKTRQCFLQSILNVKKACPRPDDRQLAKSLRESLELLTSENPLGSRRVLDPSDATECSIEDELAGRMFTPFGPGSSEVLTENQEDRWDMELGNPYVRSRKFKPQHYALKNGVWEKSSKGFLSLEQTIDTEKYKHFMLTGLVRQHFIDQIRRTVRELYAEKKLDLSAYSRPWFPSTSSNYNRNRKNMGAVGSVQDLLVGVGAMPLKPERVYYESYPVTETETKFSRTFDWEYEAIAPSVPVYSLPPSRHYALERSIEKVAAERELPLCEQVALKESFKVRVISKGPALIYDFLSPVQKQMWSVLNDHPMFRLIGMGPVQTGYLLERLGRNLKPDEVYLSVDYKSATDLLDPEVCRVILDELVVCGFLPEDFRGLMEKALTDHLLVVNKKPYEKAGELEFGLEFSKLMYKRMQEGNLMYMREADETPTYSFRAAAYPTFESFRLRYQHCLEEGTFVLRQRWGQLMGSPVSFPFLCVANATVMRWAEEVGLGKSLTLQEATSVVNGDDGLMRTSNWGVAAWQFLSARFGLKPSVGKVYCSKHYFNINSRGYFRVDDERSVYCLHRDQKEAWKLFQKSVPLRHPILGLDDGELLGSHATNTSRVKTDKGKVLYFVVDNALDVTDGCDENQRKVYNFNGKFFVARKCPFIRINLVNLGLAKGLKRSEGAGGVSTGKLGLGSDVSIGARAREFLKGFDLAFQHRLWRIFLKYNRPLLDGSNNTRKVRVPWYIPERFGGLGFPPLPRLGLTLDECRSASDFEFGPDEEDLKKLRGFILSHPVFLRRIPTIAEWRTHEWVMKELDHPQSEIDVRFRPLLPAEDYSEIYIAFAHSYLASGRYYLEGTKEGPDDIAFDKLSHERVKMILRANEEAWSELKSFKHSYDDSFIRTVFEPTRMVLSEPSLYALRGRAVPFSWYGPAAEDASLDL